MSAEYNKLKDVFAASGKQAADEKMESDLYVAIHTKKNEGANSCVPVRAREFPQQTSWHDDDLKCATFASSRQEQVVHLEKS